MGRGGSETAIGTGAISSRSEAGAQVVSQTLRIVDLHRRRLNPGSLVSVVESPGTKVMITGFGKPQNGVVEIKVKDAENGAEQSFFGEETQAGKFSCSALSTRILAA